MSTTTDRLVENYRRELRRELRDLPRRSRREVLDEIDEHIAEARAELDIESETAIRNILERLGDPAAAIAEDARERFGPYLLFWDGDPVFSEAVGSGTLMTLFFAPLVAAVRLGFRMRRPALAAA